MTRTRNFFINLTLMLFTIVVLIAVGEFMTRTFWKQGYHHPYDWRDRLGGLFDQERRRYIQDPVSRRFRRFWSGREAGRNLWEID